jgi:hypothetical protein
VCDRVCVHVHACMHVFVCLCVCVCVCLCVCERERIMQCSPDVALLPCAKRMPLLLRGTPSSSPRQPPKKHVRTVRKMVFL